MIEKDNNLANKQVGGLKVALVHDFLVARGGAERVLLELSQMYPDAPIYTLLYDEAKMRGMFVGKEIRTSYLQKFPRFLKKRYQWLLPFFPVVPETFDLRDFDLVISSSGAWSKGIVTKLDTTHIAYIHSPMRFVWDYNERYLKEGKRGKFKLITRSFFNYLRVWDRLAADRPDFLIANSQYTQKRIAKYYRRDSKVIYPPVLSVPASINRESSVESEEADKLAKLKAKGYFLIVSRLSPYKKVDMVIEAFNKLELPLIIIGEGQQAKYLRKIAKNNVKILGWKNDKITAEYFRNAKGFIFPAEDDFGMTAVEAMLYGVPVIAYKKGGVCEIVEEGVTGEFFAAQTPEVLADGIRRFMQKSDTYDKDVIRQKAQEFSKERFRKEFGEFVESVIIKSKI